MNKNGFTKRMRHLCSVVAAIVCVCGLSSITAQREGGIGLVVIPESIDLMYQESAPNEYVFYSDEPVNIAIRLLNQQDVALSLPAGQSLEQAVTRNVRAAGAATAAAPLDDVTWTKRQTAQYRLDGTEPVPPGQHAELSWTLTRSSAQGMVPGRYEVRVELPIAIERGGQRRDVLLSDSKTVEIRRAVNRADRLDALLHAGIRHRWNKRFQEARQAFAEVLALNPNSAGAYAELGAISKGEGDCPRAISEYNRALEIIAARADRESPLFSQAYALSDWTAGLRKSVASCK
jgi:tetratricopeptide (TPR) repeat protein